VSPNGNQQEYFGRSGEQSAHHHPERRGPLPANTKSPRRLQGPDRGWSARTPTPNQRAPEIAKGYARTDRRSRGDLAPPRSSAADASFTSGQPRLAEAQPFPTPDKTTPPVGHEQRRARGIGDPAREQAPAGDQAGAPDWATIGPRRSRKNIKLPANEAANTHREHDQTGFAWLVIVERLQPRNARRDGGVGTGRSTANPAKPTAQARAEKIRNAEGDAAAPSRIEDGAQGGL